MKRRGGRKRTLWGKKKAMSEKRMKRVNGRIRVWTRGLLVDYASGREEASTCEYSTVGVETAMRRVGWRLQGMRERVRLQVGQVNDSKGKGD